MSEAIFDDWLAKHLGWSKLEVEQLLCDKSVSRFLITWSLFEEKCFDSNADVRDFAEKAKSFAGLLAGNKGLETLKGIAENFHKRYQDSQRYENLLGPKGGHNGKFDEVLKKEFKGLSAQDWLFLLIYVVYRYRNNIFHGNKGVDSWVQFKVQIDQCIEVMTILIDSVKGEKGLADTGDTGFPLARE